MTGRAVSARVPFAWVAAGEAYGDNGPLRTWPEQQHIAHVPAVARDHRVPAGAGRTVRADELTITNPGPGHRCLLIRRNRSTGDLRLEY
jgi:hypothetical protein